MTNYLGGGLWKPQFQCLTTLVNSNAIFLADRWIAVLGRFRWDLALNWFGAALGGIRYSVMHSACKIRSLPSLESQPELLVVLS